MIMQGLHSQTMGWGIDGRREDRPGVPHELPPQRIGNAHWAAPEQQRSAPPSVVEKGRGITPVYGTAVPPRHLSGLIRRVAYRVPEYRPRRWMLLMLADRIDVLEHTVLPTAILVTAIGALGIAGLLGIRALRRA
jgi:hypothetical protein